MFALSCMSLGSVAVGMTTDELDVIAHEKALALGAYPSPLNYHGFPKSLCTSVNEVICHGIPDDRKLLDGDIINCDVTVYIDGVHGDCSETVFVGKPDPVSVRLVETTYECMMAGIRAAQVGKTVNAVGKAIAPVAKREGFSIADGSLACASGAHNPADLAQGGSKTLPRHFE